MGRLPSRFSIWLESRKNIGVFIEGEYTKFWDSEIFNSNFGINFTFR